MAALRDDAAERPRVNQIPSEDYVLDESVGEVPTFVSSAGAGVGKERRWVSALTGARNPNPPNNRISRKRRRGGKDANGEK